ncbi:MerC domain-containing protein [Haliangium sp. UPWRP_2]|uniref:MerC domain-containing protein n=1 Tax=Haliangium sp. UPWRP_2 TaxID=1931276 RepID=UPI000B54629E|nr:MerC domain-containing protein [Haliangium sp. UPWRP_2]
MAKDISRWFSSIGGVVAVLMPKGLCPICIAASGGMLASFGLGFLLVERNVRWLLGLTLAIGLTGFILSARRHRRWWTLAVGVTAAVTTMLGRLLLSNLVLYSGMVLLIGAMGADLWARRHPWMPLVQIRLRRGA